MEGLLKILQKNYRKVKLKEWFSFYKMTIGKYEGNYADIQISADNHRKDEKFKEWFIFTQWSQGRKEIIWFSFLHINNRNVGKHLKNVLLSTKLA